MKLIIQIPCLNEEKSLPITIPELPRSLPDIDIIEYLVIDDGSTDNTVKVAKELGVDHVLSLKTHRGLARAFALGLSKSLSLGADLIVNTDADNQYKAKCIGDLIKPIMNEKADIVIGCRPIDKTEEFSILKKKLQHWGSKVVNILAGTSIPDVTSGFRAFSRSAALQLNVLSLFSYTVETIIQAGQNSIPMTHVPIETNPAMRKSRLFRNNFIYVAKSVSIIIRIFTQFQPIITFTCLGSFFLLLSLVPLTNLLGLLPEFHSPSLIATSALMMTGLGCFVIGLVADQVAGNRRMLETLGTNVRKIKQLETDKRIARSLKLPPTTRYPEKVV